MTDDDMRCDVCGKLFKSLYRCKFTLVCSGCHPPAPAMAMIDNLVCGPKEAASARKALAVKPSRSRAAKKAKATRVR